MTAEHAGKSTRVPTTVNCAIRNRIHDIVDRVYEFVTTLTVMPPATPNQRGIFAGSRALAVVASLVSALATVQAIEHASSALRIT